MSFILKYGDWKRLFEQEEKPNKNVDKLADALGISEDEKEELEKALYTAMIEKINTDTGEKKNIMGKITDENTKNAIVEAFIYSKNTPKKFFKEPEKYKFVAEYAPDQGNAFPAFSIATPGKIPYVNTAGEEKIATSLEEILQDVSVKNADFFATGEDVQFYVDVETYKEGKNTRKRFVAKQTTANNKLFTLLEGKIPVMSTTKTTKPGTTTTTTKEPTGPTTIKVEIPLSVNDRDPNTTFKVGSSEVANPSATIEIVATAIQDALVKQGLSDLSTVKLNSVQIISSASNQWGGPVTATHSNAGAPTGKNYSDPHPSRKDPNYVKSAESNYNLAKNRGTALANAVIPGLKEKGISEIADATFDIRVTDTGGNNDEASTDGKKPGRDKTTYPNPGQFAKIIVSAETIKEEEVPGKPGEQVQRNQMTQFSLKLVEAAGHSGQGFSRILSWDLSRPKYLKKSGGWKSPGYIKRHGGGNRPISGLSRWFDGLIHSGI
jgi:hypothetical protein